MKKALRISKWVLGVLLLLLLSAYLFLLSPFGQNWLTQRIVGYLSKQWQTKIELKNARFSMFDRIQLEGLTVYDSAQDTLLHAGTLQVHITNWFFLRRENDIGPVRLEDAVIKIQRTDSVWQHDALFRHFQPSDKKTSKSSKSNFRLGDVEILRSRIFLRDDWEGLLVKGSFDRLSMQANRLDPSDTIVDIQSLILTNPDLSVEEFAGKRPASPSVPPSDFFDIHPHWSGSHLNVGSVQIDMGSLSWKKRGHTPLGGRLDPNWMQWTKLQLSVRDLRASADSLIAPFQFSGTESCGLNLTDIAGTIKGHQQGWMLQDFHLKTTKSSLHQNVSWYDSAGKSIVKVDALENRISPEDIRLITGMTMPVSEEIALKGSIRMEADRIQTNGLWIQWGSYLRMSGDMLLSNWRSANDWLLNFDRSELFARTELASRWTSISPAQQSYLKPVGFVQFRGKGQVSPTQTALTGNLRTQLGTLTGTGSARYLKDQPITYNATLKGQLEGIGGLFPGTGIQSTRLSISLSGEDLHTIKATGDLTQLQTRTYRYAPIQFNLNVNDPLWELTTNIQDPNLTGVIQVSGEPFTQQTEIGLDARLDWMDLTALGWNRDGLTLKGSLRGKFSGEGIDNLNGELQGHSLELSKNGVPYSLQEFQLKLNQAGQQRNLELRSNEMDADLRGRFSWSALPNMALQVGHQYFPSWIDAPPRYLQTEEAEFTIKTYNVESYLELLHIPIRGLSNSILEGSFFSATGQSQVKATVPKLQFGSYLIQSSSVELRGTSDSLYLIGSAEKIQVNDSISIPEPRIVLNAQRDTANLHLMAGFNQAEDKADIRSRLIAYSDGLRLDLSPSTFLIQGKLWSIDENGQLIIRKGEPVFGKISMREGDQRVYVRTIPARFGDDNDIEISVESLNLHDVAPFFLPSNELEGLITAKVRLVDPMGTLLVEADTIQTRLLRFDSDSIGELGASLVFDPITQKLTAVGETHNPEEHLSFDAKVLLSGPVDSNRILLQAHAYPIKILERFLGNLFSDIRGKLTGEVELLGDLKNPSLYGRGRLKDAGLRVNYTNCFYNIQDADIDITPTLIDLDGWVLKDSATGNPIYLRGGIAHESFRNMYYDLSATTRSLVTNSDRPVLLLNTDRSQDEVYYGTARGTLSLQLRGPQSDLLLNMQARASDKDSSYITLLSEDGRESGVADFLVEREYGREMSGSNSAGGADNFTVDLEITATPLVNAKVVLDELTGDVIRGRGNGTLKIRSGNNEPLSLRGRYNIEEGNYLFTFQSFFKKPFEIRKGGQHFVEWTGDPYDANMKLEAIYRADNVSFAPLVSSLNLGSGLKNARGDVFVNAELSGKLFQPQIRFSLDFPPNSVVDRNQELSLLINQLQKNPNELNRQVTYLIVFNSFAPSELAGDPVGSGIGVSTISGVLLNVLSDQINKLLGNLLKSDKYTINLNTSLYNRDWMSAGNNALNLGSNINFSIGRTFFNNRFIISGGLGFDAPLGQTNANANLSQSIQLLPDVTMEWLLNPSGSLRVGFFYRKSNDFLTNNTNPITARRTGGSLSYQKDYDHLGDLFRGLFRKKKNKQSSAKPE